MYVALVSRKQSGWLYYLTEQRKRNWDSDATAESTSPAGSQALSLLFAAFVAAHFRHHI